MNGSLALKISSLSRFLRSQRGFTLVELAIALVIIGLLISGILAAQSIIGSAKLKTSISLLQQSDVATSSFYIKYNQLPGDATFNRNGDPDFTGGNNDGMIFGDGGWTGSWGGELGHYWHDLVIFVGFKGSYTYPTGADQIEQNTETKLPKLATGNDSYIIVAGGKNASNDIVNYYFIAKPTEGSKGGSGIGTSASLTPSEALSIDQKIDDGAASTGTVLATDISNAFSYPGAYVAQSWAPGANFLTTGTTCTTSAGGALYKTTTTTSTCRLMIRLGSTSGNLQ
jgi:prepilin-type N-terminal cleavage/methylation domain-containing protein